MPPAQLKEAERLAKKENRTMSELFREAFRRYQEQDAVRRVQLERLRAVLEETRAEAERNGASALTADDIADEIKAYRREKRQRAR